MLNIDNIAARPDLESKCTYILGQNQISPHRHFKSNEKREKILPDILSYIGNTPLVKINKISVDEGLQCQLLAKCEFFNAGGSIKDRIALRMVEDAEKSGKLKPGDILIEPTSGNTGIGLALVAAVKGYRCIIVLPEKMSKEKVDILRALGAEIIRTPTSASWDHPDSNIQVAARLLTQIPNSHVLDQYRNASNPLAHYDSTAEEILDACDGNLDMVVCGAGTGGTIAGIARKIKEKCPTCKVIGVDPYGSILAEPSELNATDVSFYEVEGIGYDFIPTVLDRKHVDKWYKCSDKPAFKMARRLIKEEGLLCGGSSGSVMYCAIQAAKEFGMKEGQKVVVVLADSIRNYMTKYLSDDWLKSRNLLDESEIQPINDLSWWRGEKVCRLQRKEVVKMAADWTIEKAMNSLKEFSANFAAVIDTNGNVIGIINESILFESFLKNQLKPSDPISPLVNKNFKKVEMNDNLARLSSLLEADNNVLVFSTNQEQGDNNKLVGFVDRTAFLLFTTSNAI